MLKKFNRKMLGLFLAVSMTVTALSPTQSMATEASENAAGDGRQNVEIVPESGSGAADADIPARGGTLPEAPEHKSDETPSPDGSAPESGQDSLSVQTEDSPAQDSAVQARNAADGIMPLAESYDINHPVIESFEFLENGQDLKSDDTLHFNIMAYDADSGIESIEILINASSWRAFRVPCEKSAEKNLYTAVYPCSQLTGTSFYISQVRVTDYVGNYTDLNVTDDKNQYLYRFTADRASTGGSSGGGQDNKVAVSNLQIQKNDTDGDGQLSTGDSVTYTLDVTSDGESVSYATLRMYVTSNGYANTQYVNMNYSPETSVLTGTFTITEDTYPHKWYPNYISVYTESNKRYNFYPGSASITPAGRDVSFTVVQEGYDTARPEVESITIDKNGEFVQAGDVVNISIKVKEENPSDSGLVRFDPMHTNVSVPYISTRLTFNAGTGEYTGQIEITEDTYPCEWDLTYLYLDDTIGHETYIADVCENYAITYPWYFKVISGAYAEEVNDITFQFLGREKLEDGTLSPDVTLLHTQTVENVGRRASMKDLKLSIPQIAEGYPVHWTYSYNDTLADENTQLLFPNLTKGPQTYSFTAVYDKGCAGISLSYITKDGDEKTTVITKVVEKEASYQDVLDLLTLPEDARSDDFGGFSLAYTDESHNENSTVGDLSGISVKAVYNSCQVICTKKYIDPYGFTASEQFTQSYPADTKLTSVLSDLGTPPDIKGAAFDKWLLSGVSTEDVLSESVTKFDAIAAYSGKTTVESVYTYRNADAEVVTEHSLILLDGEDLTAAEIKGGAAEAFKDVKHFSGLKLSEWTADIKDDLPRYKVVEYEAVYHNRLLILRYPDDACEYKFVDKGAKYTLPTETDKYKEIIWKGYEKGATITVTEDMILTVEDAKLWDDNDSSGDGDDGDDNGSSGDGDDGDDNGSSGDQTDTNRLPDEKVAEITNQILNATDGTTINIDMKKATVIPKEVLETIRDRSVTIVLNMGEYSWTLNGMDVAATQLKDIDLEVKIDTDAIPTSLVQSLAGDNPATQLSLTHNGDFGFQASLSVNLGSEHSGETGNLYYYDSTGKLVFINSGQIAEDGTTSLTFSHASDYVIVIENGIRSVEMMSGGNSGLTDLIHEDSLPDNGSSEAMIAKADETPATAADDPAPSYDASQTGTAGESSSAKPTGNQKPKSPKTGE